MARVICTLPNASDEISGVKFFPHPNGGVISEDISDDVAASFSSIGGYTMAPSQERDEKQIIAPTPAHAHSTTAPGQAAAPAAAPAANKAPDNSELDALRAQAAGLGITVDQRWKAPRLKTEIAAAQAEKAAAEKAPAPEPAVADDDQF